MIGGVPTIAGAWVGGLVYSPVLAVVFLGLGAGAIAQVIAADCPADGRRRVHQQARFLRRRCCSGLVAGFFIMYVTGMLVG